MMLTPLKKHRSTGPAVADLLNYAAVVDDGVIVCKNGSFMAAWVYEGDDNASSTEGQREMVSSRINQALAGLGSGRMIHVDATRRSAPGYSAVGHSHFPDPVTMAIDEERRRYFERMGTLFEGYFVLTATYFPPLLAQAKFVELMFDDESEAPDHKARTHALINNFKREIEGMESRLNTVLKMHRLKSVKVETEDGRKVSMTSFKLVAILYHWDYIHYVTVKSHVLGCLAGRARIVGRGHPQDRPAFHPSGCH